jgi:hypothetical protein
MRRLYKAANLPDAHLMAGLLGREGIETRVFNENAQSIMGEIPFTQAFPEVWVMDDAQLAHARDILDRIQRTAPSQTLTLCSRCGEQNPGNFELCWQCGEMLN